MNRDKAKEQYRARLELPLPSILFLFLSLNLVICFNSCASRRAAVSENLLSAYLTDSSQFILLPPGGIEKPMDMVQYISASYGGREFFLGSWVKADDTGMEMTFFNDLGANMGELSYRENNVDFYSPIFPKSLRPEYIVADYQLCFYDSLLLKKALANCALVLEEQGNIRRVFQGKKLIIEIEKNENAVKLVNHLRGYTYTLEGDYGD